MWWYFPLIPALGSQNQVGLCEFENSLVCGITSLPMQREQGCREATERLIQGWEEGFYYRYKRENSWRSFGKSKAATAASLGKEPGEADWRGPGLSLLEAEGRVEQGETLWVIEKRRTVASGGWSSLVGT